MKNRILLFLISLLFLSCGKLLLNHITKETIDTDLMIYQNNETMTKVVYLPMIHLGDSTYFESVKKKVDSLRDLHYVIMYEGIKKGNISAMDSIILNKKFRKVTGFYLTSYTNEKNESLPKSLRNSNYISQSVTNTGIDVIEDVNIDYSLDSLIYKYEKNIKEIILNECDNKTNLLSEYKCKDTIKHNKYYLINTLRNEKIFNSIDKNKTKNIVILYGKAHRFMIHAKLLDFKYELIQGKLKTF